MSVRQLLDLLRAVFIPAMLGMVLLCGICGAVLVVTTPSGLDPLEAAWLRFYLTTNRDEINTPYGTNPDVQRFEVFAGESANDIGSRLEQQSLIGNGTLFARYAQFEGRDQDLRPGVFFLSQTMTIPQILDRLTDPVPTQVRLTVRENMRLEEIASQIDQTPLLDFTGDAFLAVVGPGVPLGNDFRARYGIPETSSLEGFLYPDTYLLDVTTTPVALRDLMLNTFERNITDDMRQALTTQGRTMYQVVTLASIVEREAVLPFERPQIASVFLNRLDIGMKLDADPTVQYQLATNRGGAGGQWWPQITIEDYTGVVGPYNTYLNTGLPPGPIVSPSLSSIRAVLFPAETQYIYFRAACSGDGSHQFSITFDEHLSKACS